MGLVWLIARRDFLARIRGKGYLFATVIGLVGILALNFAPAIGQWMTEGRALRLAVIDPGGEVSPRLAAQLPDTLASGKRLFSLVTVTPAQRSGLDGQVKAGDLDGYLVIPADVVRGGNTPITLVSQGSLGLTETARLRAALSSALVSLRLQSVGVSPQEEARLFAPPRLEAKELGATPGGRSAGESWVLTYILVLLLYLTVLMYGSYIAMGVIEEKSTRVVEILISSVRPFQLMMGKVLGTGLAALLQYGVWLAAGFGLLAAKGMLGSFNVGPVKLTFSAVDPWLLVGFLVFFIVGFFSYAGLFAAGGSLVSRSEDAQQVTTPLSLFVVVVFFAGMYALNKPDAPLSVVLSLTPLASPIVMFVRLAISQPPAWQVALSLVLSVAAILLLVALAARVFRAGVLLYGGRPGLRTVLRSLR